MKNKFFTIVSIGWICFWVGAIIADPVLKAHPEDLMIPWQGQILLILVMTLPIACGYMAGKESSSS